MKFCVVAASASRARCFSLETSATRTTTPLHEIKDLVNPTARARDSETFSDSRPGSRQAAPGMGGHAVDDRRESHRRDEMRRFAGAIVDELETLCEPTGEGSLIVCATTHLLSELREQLTRWKSQQQRKGMQVREVARELSNLSAAQLHDYLAEQELLPARGRVH